MSKKVFVSASSKYMKLGNAWEIQLVEPACPAFRGQVYQAIIGLFNAWLKRNTW